ncbi:hypothetical protein ACFL2O_05615 [Thermodesulfobacteriota bacterium]
MVVFFGLTVEREVFHERMSRMGVDPIQIDEIIKRAPIIMKDEMDSYAARRYADAVQDAGGRAVIRENGSIDEQRITGKPVAIASFEDFTMCPHCGHKQPKGNICEKCHSKMAE